MDRRREANVKVSALCSYGDNAKYQTEYSARLKVREVFAKFDGRLSSLQCLLHPKANCTAIDAHHLDESGKNDVRGWYWENLILTCPSVNQIIERAPRQEIGQCDTLGDIALEKLNAEYRNRGELLEAAAVARLSAFLNLSKLELSGRAKAASPRYIVSVLKSATKCIQSLRGVRPIYAVPLAVDTLERNVLRLISYEQIGDEVLYPLASAIGSIYRDFGDLNCARDYYQIALCFARRAGANWSNREFLALNNHIRILQAGSGNLEPARRLTELLTKEWGYGETLHEKINLFQWDHGNWPIDKSLPSAQLDLFIDGLFEIERQLFETGSIADLTSRLRPGVTLSSWDRIELIYRKADAAQRGGSSDEAVGMMHTASRLQAEGRFAVCQLGRPSIFDYLTSRCGSDTSLKFEFREPAMLQRPCYRSRFHKPVSFHHISKCLFQELRMRLKKRPPRWPLYKAVEDLL